MTDQQPHDREPVRGYSTYNVVAEYGDPDAARKALLALERHGVEAGRISLSGTDEEHSRQETGDELYQKDWSTMSRVGNRALVGAAIGSVVGALVIGVIIFIITGSGTWFLIGAVGGVAAGGALGGLWGGATGVPVSGEAFEETYDRSAAGGAVLTVHSEDRAEIDRAAAALEGTNATAVRRVGRDGRPVAG